MWTCPTCGRILGKANQPHSCKKVALEKHFAGKEKAKELFDGLVDRIEMGIGNVKVISIPCCVHLFGTYDFLAALPKKDRLELRFALDRKLVSPRLKAAVPLSKRSFKNCVDVSDISEINDELIGWLQESYRLRV